MRSPNRFFARYLAHFPELVQLFGGSALATDSADCTEGYAGTALWVAPGSEFDEEAVGTLLQESIDDERQETAFAFLGLMDEHHPKDRTRCGISPSSAWTQATKAGDTDLPSSRSGWRAPIEMASPRI